ncbi:MAG: NAD-dependent epimerase/dehydratase family protein [Cyclobacteriaceae bacterium]
MENILITGSNGQLGSVLTRTLQKIYGEDHVIATDISTPAVANGIFYNVDAKNQLALAQIVKRHKITQIYHMVAVLSAKAEDRPLDAWELNMQTFFNVLEVSRIFEVQKVFFPSSIAVFGSNAPKQMTPQDSPLNPSTVYGMSKVAGENWSQYFFHKYGLDVRSLRYPGVIGHQSLPGGGTTDYAVDIYHKALESGRFDCFLNPDTKLPMMYMDDTIRATVELMQAPSEQIKVRTAYNLAAMSFSPEEIASSIQKEIGEFEIEYQPDFRQQIAASWPQSIDDTIAREQWGWKPAFSLDGMTKVMLSSLTEKYQLALA